MDASDWNARYDTAELALGSELVVERSGRIDRMVSTPEGDRTAIDTIVRARRVDPAN